MFSKDKLCLIILGSCLFLLFSACVQPLTYPETRMGTVADTYHGTEVADPYRWLEDPDSEETRAWVMAQQKLTNAWLDEIPARAEIEDRLTRIWNYEQFGIPVQRAGRLFFSRNDGLQNQSVVYWTEKPGVEPRVLIDPNSLSEDGTLALGGWTVSDDGKWLAYSLAAAGSDWNEWRVREVDTGKDLDDQVQWCKFSGAAWDRQNTGFYYSRYDAPEEGQELQAANYFQKVYYHRIGTSQKEDRPVYHRPDQKEWTFRSMVSPDGDYLVLNIGKGTERKNLLFYQKLGDPSGTMVELIPEFESTFRYLGSDGPVFWIYTNQEAPRGKVIAIDTDNPARENWRTLIPEADEVLRTARVVNHQFIATYLKDAKSLIRRFDLNGKHLADVKLPGPGSASGFGGKPHHTTTYYRFSSFSDPGSVYCLDLNTGDSQCYARPKLDFDPDQFLTEQVFYKSKDGTKVPMFITYKKGLEKTSDNPLVLSGYGGFNIPLTPRFSQSMAAWMEMGGAFAVAGIRGGGEYGKAWHEAGKKTKKQNCFDDFIAAAEYLIAKGYTRPDKLAIRGGSNGGLLVGACMLQRPDLFGACLPEVGVMDMLRFNLFTIGWAWESDYGSPKNPEEFAALYAYSPLHNIEDGVAYPPTLVSTADHDDRVVPAHSFKFTARMQAAQAGVSPILIRIESKAGHSAGKPTSKKIEEATDTLAFLVRILDVDV